MKLPLQVATVLRLNRSWSARGFNAASGGTRGVYPSDWAGCKGCDNPCVQHGHFLCTCSDTGANACCPGQTGCSTTNSGACQCNV